MLFCFMHHPVGIYEPITSFSPQIKTPFTSRLNVGMKGIRSNSERCLNNIFVFLIAFSEGFGETYWKR